MRIVVDLQACQTPSSRNRGIGRYSLALARAMAEAPRGHDIHFALNGAFGDSIDALREIFEPMVGRDNLHVWTPAAAATREVRMRTDPLLREAFLGSLSPDIVHVTSMFEGLGDLSCSSVNDFARGAPVACTLYDLIPHIHRDIYLADPEVEQWYNTKLAYLRRTDLLLGISESACREAVEHLGMPESQVVNISSDVDSVFRVQAPDAERERALRARYALPRPFVMYTGGIDHRKNIEGLIRAFARLPAGLRDGLQLAVVCSASDASRNALLNLANEHGLRTGDVVLTGYVPEDDLVALYNACHLFAFPSWHEGFGLPALEAMRCGAPVIAANTSSLPEVVGRADAMFDPHDDAAIAAKLEEALTDDAFRASLARHGEEQAKKFSWTISAERALKGFETTVDTRPRASTALRPLDRLAFVSPLPPDRSGIADYSAQLLPALGKYYDITVIHVDPPSVADAGVPVRDLAWFERNAAEFERVIYQVGNSHFHGHMFDMSARHPGLIVLHDFFLSGIQAHATLHAGDREAWRRVLFRSHGYAALLDAQAADDDNVVVHKYPCNQGVLADAVGVLVHSPYSIELADRWLGPGAGADWSVVPLVRDFPLACDRAAARTALGIPQDAFLVCSFGHLGETKQNHRLLDAWNASMLAADPHCHLHFVGEAPPIPYGDAIKRAVQDANASTHVRITGWTDRADYDRYLCAADVAVQLRSLSRGETSAAVLDCMGRGVPTIANANGAMRFLPTDAVMLLPDAFPDDALRVALEQLRRDRAAAVNLGDNARRFIAEQHSPDACAQLYIDAIERAHARATWTLPRVARATAPVLADMGAGVADESEVARALGETFGEIRPLRQWLVDTTDLNPKQTEAIAALLRQPIAGVRVEPVRNDGDGTLRYARTFACGLLDVDAAGLEDEVVEHRAGDIAVFFSEPTGPGQLALASQTVRFGGSVEVRLPANPYYSQPPEPPVTRNSKKTDATT